MDGCGRTDAVFKPLPWRLSSAPHDRNRRLVSTLYTEPSALVCRGCCHPEVMGRKRRAPHPESAAAMQTVPGPADTTWIGTPRRIVGVALIGAGAAGAFALFGAPFGSGADPAGAQLVAVAFGIDGSAPAVSVAYCQADDVELHLPAGKYDVQLVNGADAITDMGQLTSDGTAMRFGKFWDKI